MSPFELSIFKCLNSSCLSNRNLIKPSTLPSSSSFQLSSSLTRASSVASFSANNSSHIFSYNFDMDNFLNSFIHEIRNDSWVKPLVVLSTLTILMVVLLEILVLSKTFRRKSRSPTQLFLGQILLLGLTIAASLGYSFALSPSPVVCFLNHGAVGLAYSFIFATLIVKCVFLLSLHSGSYLPMSYQLLLLFFIVSTQVTIDFQWLIYESSDTRTINVYIASNYTSSDMTVLSSSILASQVVCSQKFTSFAYSLVYDMFLICILAVLAFRIRRHRENYREALFISISVLVTILVWIVWLTGAVIFRELDRPAFIAFGLVTNSTLIFIIMYIPKVLQIIKIRWYTRRDCNYDSSQSLCAQSFVHIKPNYHQSLVQFHRPNNDAHSRHHSTHHNQHESLYSQQYNQHPVGTIRSTMDNGWTLNDHLLPLKSHGLQRISPNFMHKSIDNGRHYFLGAD